MTQSKQTDKCFACDRALGRNPKEADTRDDQIVLVGFDCYSKIEAAGEQGYQPPRGGPRLFPRRLGTCHAAPAGDSFYQPHKGLHLRQSGCADFSVATSLEVAEDTFARFAR